MLSITFHSGWLVFHSFVKRIIIPYIETIRDELDLPLRQRALCIFDIFKAHQGEELPDILKKHNIQIVYVPASCTDCLQPLDWVVNAQFKSLMKACFEDCYADEISKQVKDTGNKCLSVDLRPSVVKPLHAKWLVKSFQSLENDKRNIKSGWTQAGIAQD